MVFKRSNRPFDQLSASSSAPSLFANVSDPSQPFQLRPGQIASNATTGWHVVLDERRPFLTILRWPSGPSLTVDLRPARSGTWISLDHEGRELPVQIRIERGNLYAKWTVDTYSTAADAFEYTAEDRRKDTQLAFDLLREKHGTAMSQIYGIR